MEEVVVDIQETVEEVEVVISESGSIGAGVPVGGDERQILTKQSSNNYDTAWQYKYYDYLINVEYTGTSVDIATGKVLTATINGGTIYRYINNTRNANGYPVEDSFYGSFDGTTLNQLIITRG